MSIKNSSSHIFGVKMVEVVIKIQWRFLCYHGILSITSAGVFIIGGLSVYLNITLNFQIELFHRHNRRNCLWIIAFPILGNELFQFQLLRRITTDLDIKLFKTIHTPINGYGVGFGSSDTVLEVICA